MKYKLIIKASAEKILKRMNKPVLMRILREFVKLEENPFHPGVKKLTDIEGWRVRVGKFRIIYDIEDNDVIIRKILPREKAYL